MSDTFRSYGASFFFCAARYKHSAPPGLSLFRFAGDELNTRPPFVFCNPRI
jgi:hypothetical protein